MVLNLGEGMEEELNVSPFSFDYSLQDLCMFFEMYLG